MQSGVPMEPPHLIGVAGHSGAGKTLLARYLSHALAGSAGAALALDAYYVDRRRVPVEARGRLNFDAPEALDLSLLANHLRRLAAGETIDRPVYDFRTHVRRHRTIPLVPGRVVIVEGRLALHYGEIRALLGTRVFVATDEETCLERRLARDARERGRTAQSVREQWRATVQPMFERYVKSTRRYADLVVDGAEPVERMAAPVLDLMDRTAGFRQQPVVESRVAPRAARRPPGKA